MKLILVVDDDHAMCWLLNKLLHTKYKVVVAHNGLEAWSWLAGGTIPDLIISDIRMPGMDGIELLTHLSASGLYKNIPVLVLSGLNDPALRRKCFDLGAFAFVEKPFEPGRLLEEINHPFVSKMFL